jgi:hypothetical protein
MCFPSLIYPSEGDIVSEITEYAKLNSPQIRIENPLIADVEALNRTFREGCYPRLDRKDITIYTSVSSSATAT